MAAMLAIGLTARAQSSNFLSSVESYATSFNTNYSWTNVSYEISTGYKQVTGQGAVNVPPGFGLQRFRLLGQPGGEVAHVLQEDG